jgi:DNA-binding transcriptional MerR regulator
MILPPFDPPKYDELRAWWRLYQADDVRRLILEVQTARYALVELRAVAEGCRAATENDRPLEARMKQLNQLLRQIDTELRRADQIYRALPTPHPNAPNFRNSGNS